MRINRILIELMALIGITPILSLNINPIAPLVIFFLWFINSSESKGVKFVLSDPWHLSRWWIYLLGWEILLSFIGFSTTKPNNFIVKIPIYCMPMIAAFVLRTYSYKEQKRLFMFIMGVLLINVIQNILLFLRDPSFFESFKRSDEMFQYTNGGTTSFIQTCLFAIPCCFIIWANKARGRMKINVIVPMLLLIFYIIVINSRATTLLLFFFLVFALLYVRYFIPKIKSKPIRILLTLFILLVAFFFVVPFLNWLSNVIAFEGLSVKIGELSSSFTTGRIDENDDSSSLSVRFLLAQTSLETWTSSFRNLIVGIGDDVSESGGIFDLIRIGIGRHSQILDFLAMYGIIGTFMLFKAWFSFFSFLKYLNKSPKVESMINIVIMGYLLMAILNNVLTANQNTVMFLLLPISLIMIGFNRTIKYNN